MSLPSSHLATLQTQLVFPSHNHGMTEQIVTSGGWSLENQTKMGRSDYQCFLDIKKNQTKYPLPDSFKLIQIVDRTEQQIKGQYQWFNFPILSYSCRQLCEVAVKIIKSCDFERYCENSETERLVRAICLSYNSVSYHNFSHAFSLMHMFYQLTKMEPKFRKICTNEQLGYVLIAALAHDLNHPGTNNTYEIKTNSQLAIQTNNEAVLEKMHIQQFFTLLKTHKINIFEKSKNPEQMKQLIINVILATDVNQHFKNLQKLKVLFSTHETGSFTDQQRYFCLEQVFHACDIGNPCLQFHEYINWASLLSYEFNTQTLLEQEKQLQVTEMLRFKNLPVFYQGQIGFINYLVYPLWKQLSNRWTGFSVLLENIQTNLKLLELKSQNQKQ